MTCLAPGDELVQRHGLLVFGGVEQFKRATRRIRHRGLGFARRADAAEALAHSIAEAALDRLAVLLH